jgi:hypothetical protein
MLLVMGEKEYQRPSRCCISELQLVPCVLLQKPVPFPRRNSDFGDALTREMFGPLIELITTANLSPGSAMVKFSGAMLGGMTLLE